MENHLEKMREELESDEAQLLDVREQGEWEESHLKQAKLVPLSLIKESQIPKDLDKEKKTYLHCRSGRRVLQAEQLLLDMGFQKVIALDEGFDDLVMEGFEQD